MGGLGEGLVQDVGALAVEVDGALVVGQGLAVAGVGSSQEAGQPIHCHWAWEEERCSLLLSPAAWHQCPSIKDSDKGGPTSAYR